MKRRNYQSVFNPRQYMVSKDFEIYYYEDTNFSNVKHHTHNYYEFYFFVDGDITMVINHKEHKLKNGDVILIPPHIPHHLINHSQSRNYKRFILWISERYFEQITSKADDLQFLTLYSINNNCYVYHNDPISFASIQIKLYRILEELRTERFGKISKITLSIIDLILHLNRMAYESLTPSSSYEKFDLYQALLLYIDEHLIEDLTLDILADTFFVSKYHIAHLFKANLGISIHQYITKRRLELSRTALLSGSNITKTFHLYGFKDYSSFYRAFKKEYNLSPKEYKEIYSIK